MTMQLSSDSDDEPVSVRDDSESILPPTKRSRQTTETTEMPALCDTSGDDNDVGNINCSINMCR